MQHRLDMRNAAARRVRGKSAHEPGGDQGRGGARAHDEQEAADGVTVRPGDHGVAHAVCVRKRNPEDCSDQPGRRPHDQRHQRQHQEA